MPRPVPKIRKYEHEGATLYQGNCERILRTLKPESIQTCVTSPPYWGLRDYGTGKWRDAKKGCRHDNTEMRDNRQHCLDCGAVRIDSQLGLEETPDLYVESMVRVFREVKRVLRDDGTLWLNLGDSYVSPPAGNGIVEDHKTIWDKKRRPRNIKFKRPPGLKIKDLIGIPWKVAFALQADGWYLRNEIIWHKPGAAPEPAKDRCTKGHEHVFLLSKSSKYYFDLDAIRDTPPPGRAKGQKKRDVWTVNPSRYKGAHFATMPEELVEPCVLAGAPRDGVVLDPFAGSGTVGAVSLRLGRRWVGCELNPEYSKLARERVIGGRSRTGRVTDADLKARDELGVMSSLERSLFIDD